MRHKESWRKDLRSHALRLIKTDNRPQ